MCGIAGFFDPAHRLEPDAYPDIARRMSAALVHRGPDDSGAWSDPEAGIALGFRRLAILDLSSAGHQPMLSHGGTLVMVLNGEIYNHRDLKRDLEAGGRIAWRGTSDSEILLEAFARWGVSETLIRAEGMFALALWDRAARRLWLARDRFGEKPLYYGWSKGILVFGSELKALARHPSWTGALDRPALGLFLRHGYVPAPWSAFLGIGKLPPGTVAWFDGSEETARTACYWSAEACAAEAAADPFEAGFTAAADQLSALIDRSVAGRIGADVPVGAFLSGGIDSTAVVAAMRHVAPARVRSFSIGFPGTRYDESGHAAAVARHLGTNHTTLAVTEADCLAVLPALQQVYDEPFADASQIPTLVLSRLTRRHVTVALSGDGGDELFGGYDRYTRAEAAWRRIERLGPVRIAASGLVRLLAGGSGALRRRARKPMEHWAHSSALSLYRDQMSQWRPADRVAPSLGMARSRFNSGLPAGMPSLERAFMLLDTVTYLPDDLLVKVDRASMAASLEVRAPLLDHHIARFAWSLPPGLGRERGLKAVLREVVHRRVPAGLVDRPKQGFEPPLGRWLREGLRDWAEALLAPGRLADTGMVDPAVVAGRWREHRGGRRNWTYPLWNVLMLEAWLEQQPSPVRGHR